MVLNPAVRPLTARKTALTMRSIQLRGCIVAGLVNSESASTAPPSSHNPTLPTITSLVSSENRANRRPRQTSTIITQPRPPRAIISVMVSSVKGLETNRAAFPCAASGMMLNPALLNEDTERKMEYQ